MQNLVDSHDTQRVASAIANRNTFTEYKNVDWFDYDDGERVNARTPGYNNGPPDDDGRRIWKMLALFQATYIGAPMIYYGTEVGMWGADDPEDRMPTWWHRLDQYIFTCYQSVFKLRYAHAPLRRGSFKLLIAKDDTQLLAFERRLDDEQIIVLFNRGNENATMNPNFFKDLKLLYATDKSANDQNLPRLSGMVYGTASDQ